MNCQKLALRTIQSDGGGRLRSRQLREGVKIPAPPLYNDVGHAFHSDFFYSLTHCFQAKKKMPLQTNRSVDQVSVGKQAQILDTHILLWCKEVLPRKLSCILLTYIIALINTPLLSLRCLAWTYTPPFLKLLLSLPPMPCIYTICPKWPTH